MPKPVRQDSVRGINIFAINDDYFRIEYIRDANLKEDNINFNQPIFYHVQIFRNYKQAIKWGYNRGVDVKPMLEKAKLEI